MSDRVLNVKNLSVKIPLAGDVLHAVDNISLSVAKGETLCIGGESGCGKALTSLAIMDVLPKKAIREAMGIRVGCPTLVSDVSSSRRH